MAEKIYLYDRANGNKLRYAIYLDDGQAMPDSATRVVCPDGLYNPCFDEQAQTWKGITKEEWEAKLPQHPIEPSESAQAMNALGLRVAQLTIENNQLKESVNALGLQVAKAIATNNKENGGN